MTYEEAALNAPPEPSRKRPETMAEDYRRWLEYWWDWYMQPEQQRDEGMCESCVNGECTTGPACVTLGRDS